MEKPNKPNIIFIIADDHRHSAIHAFGDEQVHTPNLDSLVRDGVAFNNTYITGGLTPAVCVPSRACVLTGTHALHASETQQLNHQPGLTTINPELAVLPNVMKGEGYHTFGTGKWHNDRQSFYEAFCDGGKIFMGGMSDHDKVPVFDFDPNGDYDNKDRYYGEKFSTDLFSDEAIQFLEKHKKEQPFFLYLAFTSPHDPRTAPKEFADQYNPDNIKLPDNYMEEHPFDNGEMTIRDEKLAEWPRTPGAIRQHIADYYAMITHMDDRIGRILRTLEETGELENTIIVYTSDHGLAVGQHGLMGKQNMYDHSVRIPLIISGPGLPKGKQFNELTCQYDIFPTLCDLVGIEIPQTVEGKSLVPLINGDLNKVHEGIFSVYKDSQRMVTDGEWKLIRYFIPWQHNFSTNRFQLFNLKEDPWEINDLSEDPQYSEQIERMISIFKDMQSKVRDPWAYRSVSEFVGPFD